MTEPLVCSEARDLAPEVALGIAEARDRARLLGHVATCTDCQALLTDLSKLVDDVVALVPSYEPPAGFESRVLAHPVSKRRFRRSIAAGVRRHGLRSRLRALALGTVASVVAALAAGGYVHAINEPDRDLAASVRSVLSTANGQYFIAVPLLDGAGAKRGSVFAYQGDPAWLFITVRGPLDHGTYMIKLTTRDGRIHRLASDARLNDTRSWGGAIPVAVHEVSLVRIFHGGKLLLTAKIVL